MKNLILFLTTAFATSFFAQASDLQIDLNTQRGSLIKIDIYNPGLASLLVLAPGQGCNARLDMYDSIAGEGKTAGFTVVRLYWAYCVADPQGGIPSNDFSNEKEDFITVLNYVRDELKFNDTNISIGGKSMGTGITWEVFALQKYLNQFVMLTPICTDSETEPSNHKNIFSENYPGLDSESRNILLVQGNADPYCETNHFQSYISNKGNNFVPLVVKGTHSFGINNPDGQFNAEQSTKNLKVISKWIFTWLK